MNPLEILLPYQRDWLEDESQFRIACFARQCGKSTMTAADMVLSRLVKPNTLGIIVSVGARQANEYLRKCIQWAKAFEIAAPQELKGHVGFQYNVDSIRFNNGSRIVSLPSNPDGLRGYSPHDIVIDEFGVNPNDEEIWESLAPSVTNPLSGKKRISIISTPKGLSNRFSKIWHSDGNTWSKHFCDIHMAKNAGLNIDIEGLRNLVDDELIFSQEYECKFTSNNASAFDISKIKINQFDCDRQNLWIGMDIGRTNDKSAIVVVGFKDGNYGIIENWAARGLDFDSQLYKFEEILAHYPKSRISGFIDSTGIGRMLAETIEKKHNTIKCYNFTHSSKNILFDRLKGIISSEHLIVDNQNTVDELASIQRIQNNGNYSYNAINAKDGHADTACALALAITSAIENPVSMQTPISYNRQSAFGTFKSHF